MHYSATLLSRAKSGPIVHWAHGRSSSKLLELGERYAIAIRSWEQNWDELATMFEYPAEIRRLIYTTNCIEGYNR